MLGRDGSDTAICVASRSHAVGRPRAERRPAAAQRTPRATPGTRAGAGGARRSRSGGIGRHHEDAPGRHAGPGEAVELADAGHHRVGLRTRATTRRATSVSDSPPDTTVTVVDAGTGDPRRRGPGGRTGQRDEHRRPGPPRTRASTTTAAARAAPHRDRRPPGRPAPVDGGAAADPRGARSAASGTAGPPHRPGAPTRARAESGRAGRARPGAGDPGRARTGPGDLGAGPGCAAGGADRSSRRSSRDLLASHTRSIERVCDV